MCFPIVEKQQRYVPFSQSETSLQIVHANSAANQNANLELDLTLRKPYFYCSIFLIDHAWTYRVDQARKQLAEYPGLVARMSALMDINTEGKTAEEITEKVLEEMWK